MFDISSGAIISSRLRLHDKRLKMQLKMVHMLFVINSTAESDMNSSHQCSPSIYTPLVGSCLTDKLSLEGSSRSRIFSQ
jgi:hypothetical protein